MKLDFYANAAQILAIVVLALVFDSKYFENLDARSFKTGFWAWNPKKIRRYSTFVAVWVIAGIALCLVVLSGLLPNSTALRWIVGAFVAVTLSTFLFRMCTHIWGKDGSTSSATTESLADLVAKLRKFQGLRDNGQMSPEEYEAKRTEVINSI